MNDKIKNTVLQAAEDILGLPRDEMENNLDLDLFDNNLIDSLSCVAMINAISESLDVEIDIKNFTPDDYASLKSIGEAIERITH